jgi:hypothetical protein
MRARQARLKSKFWQIYPRIQSGLWHNASALAHAVLYRRDLAVGMAGSGGSRTLPDEHFEFRHGDPPRPADWSGAHTRSEDRA